MFFVSIEVLVLIGAVVVGVSLVVVVSIAAVSFLVATKIFRASWRAAVCYPFSPSCY